MKKYGVFLRIIFFHLYIYFMKKVVLSLERDVYRREVFFAQPQSEGFEVFYAVDAQKQGDKQRILSVFNQQKAERRYGRRLSFGEMACTLSHLDIFRYFIETTNDEYIIICEDDALFSKDFDIIHQVLNNQNNDIVLFGESKVRGFERSFKKKMVVPLQFFPQRFGKYRLGLYDGVIWGTVGYAVSRRFAQAILQQKDIFWVADDYNLFTDLTGARVVCLLPRLVVENLDIASNLEEERKKLFRHTPNKRHNLLYKIRFKIRKAKDFIYRLLLCTRIKWRLYLRSKQ